MFVFSEFLVTKFYSFKVKNIFGFLCPEVLDYFFFRFFFIFAGRGFRANEVLYLKFWTGIWLMLVFDPKFLSSKIFFIGLGR